MGRGKAHIMWVSDGGSGKIRSFLVSPPLLRVFLIIVAFCVFSVPFLEKGVLTLATKVSELEDKREQLQSEILTLRYVKRELDGFEEKEMKLRNYFGMEQFHSLDQITGGGGISGLHLSRFVPREHLMKGVGDDEITNPDNRPSKMNLQEKLHMLGSKLDIHHQMLLDKEEAWNRTPSIVPVDIKNPRISSGFGWRMNPFTSKREFHAGVDLAGAKGTKVIAPSSGTVTRVGYDRWLGNYMVLQHTDEIKTIYGHLLRVEIQQDTQVKRGDLLGFMGNTGLSTSRHLHYMVVADNRAVDPMQFLLDING